MHHGPGSAGLQRGFTLIELMIVVATIAVLALIAFPSYMDTVRKGRRADAMAGLMRLQQAQERYRGNASAYASAIPTGTPSDSPEGHYSLAVDEAAAATYKVSATAKSTSPQYADTKCRRMTVQMQTGGAIVTTSFDANNVETTTTARCWVK